MYLWSLLWVSIYILLVLKPLTTDWGLNPAKTLLGMNSHGWDSNPAKTHGTWFQDQVKLGFLVSHCRKNSVRDRLIGKKWIYSDTERSTLHSVGYHSGRVRQVRNVAWLVYIGWVISYANEWEDYSNCSGEGLEISRIWATVHSLVF